MFLQRLVKKGRLGTYERWVIYAQVRDGASFRKRTVCYIGTAPIMTLAEAKALCQREEGMTLKRLEEMGVQIDRRRYGPGESPRPDRRAWTKALWTEHSLNIKTSLWRRLTVIRNRRRRKEGRRVSLTELVLEAIEAYLKRDASQKERSAL